MTYLRMENLDLKNKRVIIRVDFNVPIEHGIIQNDARLRAALPTLEQAIAAKACVIILSHLGRPKEGEYSEAFSLQPVAMYLSRLLNYPVRFQKNWLDGFDIAPGEIVLCENVRFNSGEEANDLELATKMAALCDIFVMDAFATAHRAHASTVGIARFAPIAVAGPLLVTELETLSTVLTAPKRPLVAIVGGSKVSTKIGVLKFLINVVDVLIVGGGIANTFIAAQGHQVGNSLVETGFIAEAQALIAFAKTKQVELVVPTDVVVAQMLSLKAHTRVVLVNSDDMLSQDKIVDIGPLTIKQCETLLMKAGTILWNGPVGVFEYPAFEQGTKSLAEAIAASTAFSVVGGGETIAAIDKYGVSDKMTYVSTGGGAFLEYLEGKTLPAVQILEERKEG